jgi:hypothetical protein
VLRQREVDLDRLRELGTRSTSAFAGDQQWIFRRVESIAFEGSLIRRRISVDFAIPRGLPSTRRGMQRLFYVPLSVLTKSPPLLNFDLRVEDQQGHLLTTEGNAVIDDALMRAFLAELLGPARAACCEDAVHILTGPCSPEESQQTYDQIERFVGNAEPLELRRSILRLAHSLRRSYVLWVPVVGNAGERHIAYFSYDQLYDRYSGLGRRVIRTLAWGGGDEYVEVPHVGQYGSYHIDVRPPPGLRVEDADLYFVYERPEPGQPSPQPPPVETQIADECAHLYAVGERPGSALLRVRMMPNWRGFLAGAWMAAVGIAALLTAFWRWADQLTKDPTAAVTVLVIVPALLGVVALRPTAHPRVFARLYGVQLLLYVSGALSVLSALVAIRYEHLVEPTRALWRDAAYGSYLVLGAVTVSLLRAVRR